MRALHEVERWTSKTWRVRVPDSYAFGQVTRTQQRSSVMWHAEIRDKETVKIMRYAGTWARKRDAIEECCDILASSAYQE